MEGSGGVNGGKCRRHRCAVDCLQPTLHFGFRQRLTAGVSRPEGSSRLRFDIVESR